MKQKGILVLLFALLLAFAACGAGDGVRRPADADEISALEKIQRKLMDLTNYRAIATVEYRSNKGSNIYETIQHARITGEYRIEITGPAHVAGSVTTNNGAQINQFNTRVNGRISLQVEEAPERSEIFLTSFIKNYILSEEISIHVADMEEGVRTVLEATIPGNHPYMAIARLWVDNATLAPVKMIIFDAEGSERIIVTYHVFEYNVEMDDALFTV